MEKFVLSLPGTWDPGIPIAAARAGAVGILDLTWLDDPHHAYRSVKRLVKQARMRFGLLLHARIGAVERSALDALSDCDTILLDPGTDRATESVANELRQYAARIGLVVNSLTHARLAESCGLDLVVAKGHEAGGVVGEETTFVLVQRLLDNCKLPVVAWGGIWGGSAAACRMAGLHGVALDWQLALARESPLDDRVKSRIRRMDGSETSVIQCPDHTLLRYFAQPGFGAQTALETLFADTSLPARDAAETQDWSNQLIRLIGNRDQKQRCWLVGQDAAFAPGEFSACSNVAQVLAKLDQDINQFIEGAVEAKILAENSPLALSHGTRFPVVQGPMTRVSDVPEFCRAVYDAGGLPFLALALLRKEAVEDLLRRTSELMGDHPWGIGILGFVDRDLRREQLEVVEKVRPPFAIIAGGRPDQAASLQERGIATYLHVPSPRMLEMFLSEGARRFVFEGRECGGHVGPRTSFVLWGLMIEALLNAKLSENEASRVHVLFAGGIHDAISAAMVSVLAQPLVGRGMKVGVLLGTAYIFTDEIVTTGAVVPAFQDVALTTDHTVLLETGPGHATRCANTEFYDYFKAEKARLISENKPAEQIRDELEHLNLGRLRIASKGRKRVADGAGNGLSKVDQAEQLREGMYMLGQIAAIKNERFSIRDLHNDVCNESLALLRSVPREEPASIKRVGPEALDIAIIGMGCFLPGANDPEQFWENILSKVDAITEVPEDHFNVGHWYHPDGDNRDKINSRWGGFLDRIEFDPIKYGIPPAAMSSIDPAQIMALELVNQALIDAGYRNHNTIRERTSVIFGVGGGITELGLHYAFRSLLPKFVEEVDERVLSQLPEWTEDSFAGVLGNVITGRVSNRFDFGGVNFTTDAACASSLAAIYQACRELSDQTSDMVIAGGCDTVQNPFSYLCFASAGALSPRGRARTFDASADGTVISEGLAAVVLKRRDDAERDGDRIYAVIRAVGGASDGRSKGLSTPRLEGQVRALERAYEQAAFPPTTIGLFEAHGTGTVVGDRTECLALRSLLNGTEQKSIAVGSVKSAIGHTKCAAGTAGLIKAALSLQRRVLPPTLHVQTPNPKAGLDDGPLFLCAEPQPWIQSEYPRRAGVSSFGFGGTNFHVVLEEYDGDPRGERATGLRKNRPGELFIFSDNSRAGLSAKITRFSTGLKRALKAGAELRLLDLAYTVHRQMDTVSQATHVASIVSSSVTDLIDKLERIERQLNQTAPSRVTEPLSKGIFLGENLSADQVRIAFLFPGQGSQFPNMLRELAIEFSEVSETFTEADRVLSEQLDRPLSRFICPPAVFTDQDQKAAADNLKATHIAQPALGACDVAILRLLRSFGVLPDMVAGHSYGELVALHAAGCIDAPTLFSLSYERGRAIMDLTVGAPCDLGQMLAVTATETEVLAALGNLSGVGIANRNSPRQLVLSGSTLGIQEAERRLLTASFNCVRIPVACAFHSPVIEPARRRFAEVLSGTDFDSPKLPVYSNTTGTIYPKDPDQISELLCDHLVMSVHFVDQIQNIHREGARVFVEVGPNGILSRLVDETLSGEAHTVVTTSPRNEAGLLSFLEALAKLSVAGIRVDLERLFEARQPKILDLPAEAEACKVGRPAHLWWVNAVRAWPMSARVEPILRVQMMGDKPNLPSNPDIAAATVKGSPRQRIDPHRSASTPVATNSEFAESPVADLEMGDLMEFQVTMRAFLETQQKVMEAYLQGGQVQSLQFSSLNRAGAIASVSAPSDEPEEQPLKLEPSIPLMPALEHRSDKSGTSHSEAVVDSGADVRLSRPELEQRLLALVAERTGYPTDALSMDVNLEADLGIDSIKRVEIMGAFRRVLLPSLDEPPKGFMERMSQSRSLNEILDTMQTLLDGEAEAAPKQPARADVPAIKPGIGVGPSRPELEQRLLALVAERTGYPTDALSMDVNLEADLGIDSIKRVEIMGAFRRALLPSMDEPPNWFMERMSETRSLNGILEVMETLLETPAEAEIEKFREAGARKQSGLQPEPCSDSCPCCVVVPGYAPVDAEAAIDLIGRVLLVTDDGRGVSKAVLEEITRRGGEARIVPEEHLVNAASAKEFVQLTRIDSGRVDGLIHLLPLRQVSAYPGIDNEELRNCVQSELKGLLYLIQALASDFERKRSGPFCVLCFSQGGGEFSGESADEAIFPWRGGLAGMLKTAAKEWDFVRWRSVDVDELPDVSQVMYELGVTGNVEVGIRNGKRMVNEVKIFDSGLEAGSDATDLLNENSVVLVTGGARGITAEIAKEIACRSGAKFILVGRSVHPGKIEDPVTAGQLDAGGLRGALTKHFRANGQNASLREVEKEVHQVLAAREIRRTLKELADSGSKVEYIPCDVADQQSLSRLVEDVQARHGTIDVLVHGAGTIEDRYIRDKTDESFDRVFDSKVGSINTLTRLLDLSKLKLVVLFSSVSGFMGNPGQVDYAAANETLNRIAHRLAKFCPGRVVSLNWGPWSGTGMV
ncbi:MAG: SDR family NAD(P)-dependent oxidoreductase, partial [Methylococcales bacterium]